MTATFIGQPVSRVDGRQKVTGTARYAAEFDQPGQAYGVIVRSTVANGRILSIDSAAAEASPGVVAVLTPPKAPRPAYRGHKGAPHPQGGGGPPRVPDDPGRHQGQTPPPVIRE